MSAFNIDKVQKINCSKLKKNCGVINSTLIVCINDNISVDNEKELKQGYEDMAEINLEYSKMGLEYMLDDVNEYEAWICGVWLLKMANIVVKRGEIFYADLSPVIGSEQGGIRPVIIIQNDIGNRYSPTVIVAAITSQINKAKLPIHVEISSEEYGLNRESVVLLEQIRTLDKRRLKEKIGHMTETDMKKVDKALAISLNLS